MQGDGALNLVLVILLLFFVVGIFIKFSRSLRRGGGSMTTTVQS